MQKVSWQSVEDQRTSNSLFPKVIRCLVIGSSGAGKTFAALNMILQELVYFEHLIIVSPSVNTQPEYQIIKQCFREGLPCEEILNVFKNEEAIVGSGHDVKTIISAMSSRLPPRKHTKKNILTTFEKPTELPDPSQLKAFTLVLFDDLMLDKEGIKVAEAFFTRGRPLKISSIFITQSYYQIPRRTIRENCNLLLLFKQNKKNLQHIHKDVVDPDMSFKEFEKLCNDIWVKNNSFVCIDLTLTATLGKYRRGFYDFWVT